MASTSIVYTLVARDSASQTFNKVGKSTNSLGSGFAKLSKIASGVGVGIAAIGAAAVDAAEKAVQFQASMTKIQTQAGASASDVKELGTQVLALGGKVQQGPQELSAALYHLKSVGMDNVDAMKALKTASDLAAVGGADLESTTNALAGAWRTGIKGAKTFAQTAGTVNAVIGAGNMTMQDFTDAIGTGILPSAKTFGLSLQSVGAALALFTDEGVPATDAATRLRMSISLLGAPSAKAEKQLGKIGLTGTKLANDMRSPAGLVAAIGDLKTHLDNSGLSATASAQLLSRAFGGGRSSGAILSMVNNFDVLKKKQDQVNSSIGKYGAAVATQKKTAEAQLKKLQGAWETLLVEIGSSGLLDAVTKATNGVVKALGGVLTFMSGTVEPAFGRFTAKFESLIPVDTIQRDVAKAKKLTKQITDALGLTSPKSASQPALKTAPHLGSGQTAPTPPPKVNPLTSAPHLGSGMTAPLGKALSGSGSTTMIADWSTSVSDAMNTAIAKVNWNKVGQGISDAIKFALGEANKLTNALSGAMQEINWPTVAAGLATGIESSIVSTLFSVDFWKNNWKTFANNIIPGGVAASFLEKPAEDLGTSLTHGIKKGIADDWAKFKTWANTNIVSPMLNSLRDLLGIHSPSTVFATIGGQLMSGLKNGILNGITGIGAWLTKHVVNPVKNAFSGAGSWLVSKGTSAINGLKNGVLSAASDVGAYMSKHVISPIKSAFKSAPTMLKTYGSQAISGLKSGVTSALKGIDKWISTNLTGPIIAAVRSHFVIASPSKVFQTIGGHLVTGLIRGMATLNGEGVVKKIFGTMPDALAALVSKGLIHITDLPSKAMKALGGLGGDILGLLGLGGGSGSAASSANQKLGKKMMEQIGWSDDQWPALKSLWNGESNWSATAYNKSSGATGIPQALPGSKMASAGKDWRTNPATQILWGLGYIRQRYGSPGKAYSDWLSRSPHWYDQGGMANGKGMMLKNTNRPERVLSPRQTEAFETLVQHLTSGGSMMSPEINLHFDDPSLRDLIRVEATPIVNASAKTQAYRARVGRRG